MTSKSGAGEKQSRPNLETTDNLAEDCSRNERPQLESRTSRSRAPTDSIQAPSASDADPQCTGQKFQCKEKTSAHTVITSIRATGVALGLRRLPAGFYTVVHHTGLEWRTENKCSSVGDDVVEWSGPIPLPLDLSAIIRLEVYASFEFQPMLGTGEHLRELTMTVDQLLDCSGKHVPFSLFPKNGDIVSPCSSILVMVNQRNGASSDSSASRILGPLCVTRRLLSTTAALNELEDATSHGHSALSRYQKHGGKRDLERSVTEFERALNNCPLDHPCRAAVQSNLALAKLILCQVEDTVTSLEIPIHMYRDALAARPVGHAGRPSTLVQLAAVHLARFKKWRDDLDGARVEALLHEALELSSTDSHENRAVSFMLQLYATHRVGPDHASGQSDSHPSSRLTDEDAWVTSVQLLKRFKRYGDLTDIERAIRLLQRLVKSVSVLGDGYCARLGNLGVALLWRFEHVGELSDLEDAISTLRDANDLTPDGHPDKPSRLNDLGLSFITRFECLRELGDLEHAISTLRNVTDLTPDGHPDKPSRLNNLGSSFITRFERVGELSDLEHAISTLKDAADLTPHGHPHKPCMLRNLGNSFIVRFERLGELSDLEHAISTLRDATDLTPHGHPHKPSMLNNLGNSFITHFERRLGKLSDLEHAISTLREAVDLTPDGHPDKPSRLSNLGISFRARFKHLGELSDLEDAISTHREAVGLTPHGHPHQPDMLNNLGNSFMICFKRFGELSDLEHAISTLRDATDLTPHGHPHKPGMLNNLGISFRARFERLGELRDLEDAISIHRKAVDLTPHGHPDKQSRLNNLGISFRARFDRLGELSDLEDAISTHREAVALTPDGHPDKPSRLNSLGNSFITRFERLGELSDLEHAISTLRDATDLTPDGHPDKPSYLNNLGHSFITRFVRLGELNDLDHSILSLREAVDLTPHGHHHKPGMLNNLGNSFIIRFERLGELSDLEHDILTLRDATDLTPHGHPHKPSMLNSLGLSIITRFKRVGELSDLEHAILTLKEAVDLTPHGHPDKLGHMNSLGNSFITRFERLREPSDLKDAISLYSHAASVPIGPISVRFRVSLNWILCARRMHHPSLLRAHSVAINLFPQLAWIGLSLTHRYAELKQGANVVCEAAAGALDSGFPELAVEWLEQGRSVVWGELLQLRGPYEQLPSAHPDHARRLQELSAALEDAGATREKSLSTVLGLTDDAMQRATQTLEQEANRHRTLAIERDKLLQEIRRLPGFERFLFSKGFAQLRVSAHSGPVVILNAAETRCDALILLADVDHVIHVPLPDFNLQRSVGLQNMLRTLLGHRDARATPFDDRKGRVVTPWGTGSWETLLSTLFNGVIKPVLDALAFSTVGDLSRIFWCPTGPFVFLPIHAAGLYGTQYSSPGHKVSDFVVSSYIPTLSILEKSNFHVAHNDNLCLLLVGQPLSDGQDPLQGVAPELRHIRTVVGNPTSACTTLLESSVGMVEEVLGLMKDADWVHFACHGIQDAANPTDSGLCLADKRRLKISDIIGLSRSRGGLAFLSACQTAMGDEGLTDEAIHIAAGMLFAGYGGVIGTMWSISDRFAPIAAGEVYNIPDAALGDQGGVRLVLGCSDE
ncbi:TPR-like protein [Boletus edulis]|nr:TPR-like protein [Boletus edulis]